MMSRVLVQFETTTIFSCVVLWIDFSIRCSIDILPGGSQHLSCVSEGAVGHTASRGIKSSDVVWHDRHGLFQSPSDDAGIILGILLVCLLFEELAVSDLEELSDSPMANCRLCATYRLIVS